MGPVIGLKVSLDNEQWHLFITEFDEICGNMFLQFLEVELKKNKLFTYQSQVPVYVQEIMLLDLEVEYLFFCGCLHFSENLPSKSDVTSMLYTFSVMLFKKVHT